LGWGRWLLCCLEDYPKEKKKKEKKESLYSMKLHLGCGKKHIHGFVHVDRNKEVNADYHIDIKDLWPFRDKEAELIYSCHNLEYFSKNEAVTVLYEWKRVLKPDGELWLAVPDFEGITRVYQKYGDIKHRGILGPLFGEWDNHDTAIYHKTVYDLRSLSSLLRDVGFKNIKRITDFGFGIDDYSMAYIPHKDKSGIPISLNIKCSKE